MKRERARGFFAAFETQAYLPSGCLLGQETPDSCAAACGRMLLMDYLADARGNYEFAESFLRDALKTGLRGTSLPRIAGALVKFGMPLPYVYRKELSLAEFARAVRRAPVISFIKAENDDDYHAVLVDRITDEAVYLRDPLPQGCGSAYRIALSVFLTYWLNPETQCGHAVAVVG